WNREIRGMHDVTGPAVSENRMELILARRREAAIPALLETDEFFIAEIPAAWPLIDVAADRSGVTDLRRSDLAGSGGKHGIQSGNLLVLEQIHDLHGRADLHASVGSAHGGGFERILDVYDAIGLLDIVLHSREQIHAARERKGRSTGFQCGDGFFLVGRVYVSEGFHRVPPALWVSLMASSTLCGVNGRLRIVAPEALRTAHAIAAAVDTVGGSPIPITPRSGCCLIWTSICGISDMPARRYHSIFGFT